jgi:hypothetical protein
MVVLIKKEIGGDFSLTIPFFLCQLLRDYANSDFDVKRKAKLRIENRIIPSADQS